MQDEVVTIHREMAAAGLASSQRLSTKASWAAVRVSPSSWGPGAWAAGLSGTDALLPQVRP